MEFSPLWFIPLMMMACPLGMVVMMWLMMRMMGHRASQTGHGPGGEHESDDSKR